MPKRNINIDLIINVVMEMLRAFPKVMFSRGRIATAQSAIIRDSFTKGRHVPDDIR